MMERTDGPVKVREYRATGDGSIYNVAFEQSVLRPLNNSGAMLNVLMAGHSSFGSPYQTRVAYQNMSKQQFEAFGLDTGATFPENWKPRLVVHEFCEGDEIPQSLRASFPTVYKTDRYEARTWTQMIQGEEVEMTEKPKMSAKVAGREQEAMTRDGKYIYRNVFFTIEGLDQQDYLIQHDNNVTGTTNAIREAGLQQFETPDLP